jgi:hypothetical protein
MACVMTEALEETDRANTYVPDASAVPRALFTSVAGIDTVDPDIVQEMATKIRNGIELRENLDRHDPGTKSTSSTMMSRFLDGSFISIMAIRTLPLCLTTIMLPFATSTAVSHSL